jgi:monoamine oxidase
MSDNTSKRRQTGRRMVIVVGAGFSGLIAARELEAAGIDVKVFEARDRIGGRTWTREISGGHPLEMGATWVHWFQPFIWTEIARYGQGIYPSPPADRVYWISDGTVRQGNQDDFDAIAARTNEKIFEGSRAFFPYPHDPFALLRDESTSPQLRERFLKADAGSLLDCLRTGGYSQEEIDVADAFWSAACSGTTSTGSPLMAKNWGALSDHRSSLMDDQLILYKLENGMRGLYEAIAADLRCDVALGTPVQGIAHDPSGVRVTLANGATETADAAIVTAPIGALKNLRFSPALPADQQTVIREKTNSVGAKIWIKIEGRHAISAWAPSGYPLTMVKSETFLDDEDATILVGFGPDHTALELTNVKSAQQAINVWRDDLHVLGSDGHDWVADKWSGQTWATLKPDLGHDPG